MPDYSETLLRMVANSESEPTETDAPEDAFPPYDAGLQVELLEYGPEALREFGMIVVRNVGNEARYKASIWEALAHDLVYENRGDVMIITDPKA